MNARHHVVRITSQGYQALSSHQSRADALRELCAKDCRLGAVIYRDGTTGKRYCHNEARQLAVLEAS